MQSAAQVALAERADELFHSIVVETDPSSIEAEAVRGLRTRIMAQHVREGRRALTICTPTQETGCSFVAANLAVALAQIGIKTALVDADLRDPAISEMFGLSAVAPGLTDYLSDERIGLEAVLQTTDRANLSIVTAGALAQNPQELLSSARFKLFVDQMLREFDLTIFDSSPTNACTDAQRVATISGYSLVVARRHKSFMKDIKVLTELLRADRSIVVGTVLNDF